MNADAGGRAAMGEERRANDPESGVRNRQEPCDEQPSVNLSTRFWRRAPIRLARCGTAVLHSASESISAVLPCDALAATLDNDSSAGIDALNVATAHDFGQSKQAFGRSLVLFIVFKARID